MLSISGEPVPEHVGERKGARARDATASEHQGDRTATVAVGHVAADGRDGL